jgi:SAM-dependent methyltransferase
VTQGWRAGLERLIARGYARGYDRVVEGFPPYEALRAEVAGYVQRSAPPGAAVIDVACGIGNVCLHLGAMGYAVRGFDPVDTLVDAARAKHRAAGAVTDVRFEALDVAQQVPDAGTFDVLVSMNTLYWHPDPDGLLRACRAALRPGGCAVLVTYTRRARVARTVREVAARDGVPAGLAALRWLVPTAAFELLRDFEPRYPGPPALRSMIEAAGFEILEERDAFLAGLCRLVWARAGEPPPPQPRGAV